MAQLIASTELTVNYTAYEIEAPGIAASARPGHMVLFRSGGEGRPAPCAITDCDAGKGTVTIVARTGVHADTDGNSFELTGPLGCPPKEERSGKIVCIAEGLGVAALLPRLREYKQKGWYTQVIVGYASRDTVYWTNRLNEFSDELYVVTEDGSLGIKGPIRHTIKAVCEQTADIDRVFAVGPIQILKSTTDVTRKNELPTWISLNAVFDGNGVAAADPSDASLGTDSGSIAAAGEPGTQSAADDEQPLPAFDWSEAGDLNGLEQDFNELTEKLGITIKK